MGECASTLQSGTGTSEELMSIYDWYTSVLREFGVELVQNLDEEMFRQKDNEKLASLAHQGVKSVFSLLKISKVMAEARTESQNKVVKSQESVIELQKQLLDAKNEIVAAKDEQLATLTATVEAKVGEVREEVKGYSAAVQSGITGSNHTPVMFSSEVKTAVRTALVDRADEVGREANIVVFGLKEDAGEKVGEKVSELFKVMGEKPIFEAKRVGVSKNGQTSARPVKIVMRNGGVVKQILGKAAKLRDVEGYRNVYLSPDRTPVQRDERRVLVTELKKRRVDEPLKSHYIRGGTVVTVE